MISRRSILAFLGLAPAAVAAPLSDLSIGGNVHTRLFPRPNEWNLPPHLQKLVRCFNPRFGDLGRATQIQSLEEIIQIKNQLKDYGFEPFLVPGLSGPGAQFLPLYAANGAPAYGVWYGFVREHAGKHEAIAFETTPEEVKNAGFQTLNEAINS